MVYNVNLDSRENIAKNFDIKLLNSKSRYQSWDSLVDKTIFSGIFIAPVATNLKEYLVSNYEMPSHHPAISVMVYPTLINPIFREKTWTFKTLKQNLTSYSHTPIEVPPAPLWIMINPKFFYTNERLVHLTSFIPAISNYSCNIISWYRGVYEY